MDTAIRPIPGERDLSEEEYRLTRWILEHSAPEAELLLAQLDRARVVSRCACGCASVDFEVEGEPARTGAPYVLGEFLGGEAAERFGIFVFQRGGRLAGVEVYGLAGDPPSTLPAPEQLRSFEESAP